MNVRINSELIRLILHQLLKRGENTRLMDSNLIWLTTLTVLILIIAYSLKRLALQVKALVGFSFYLTEKTDLIWRTRLPQRGIYMSEFASAF